MDRVQKSRRVKGTPLDRGRLMASGAVDEAMREAVRHALLTHKRAGNPVASWKDGRVVIIPAEEIQVEEKTTDSNGSQKD